MVLPQRRQGSKNDPLSFAAGIGIGCLLMYVLVGGGGGGDMGRQSLIDVPVEASNKNNNNNIRSLSSPSDHGVDIHSDEVDNGWHAIHVFYGDKKGLGADPSQQWFAQSHQDEIVLDLVGTSGYFIDLAANDAIEFSNTLALEQLENWHGLCIEPNPTYWYGLSHRKCTVVAALMGGDKVEQVQVKFRGVFGGIVGKMNQKLANFKKEPQAKVEQRYTVPLTEVLKRYNVPKQIDYMSLDIEGAEFMVMQHFPFEEYQIKVLTVERPDKDLHALFNKNGYIHLKDLTWWGETLWAHESTGLTPEHPKIKKIVTEGK